MAVPNTTTFTLQNVVDEVNPTTDDLAACFTDADECYFDPTYEGSKNNLLNFRNYKKPVITTAPLARVAGALSTSSTTTVTPGYPLSMAANDVMFLSIAHAQVSVITAPPGWTILQDFYPITNDSTQRIFWKRATGSESGTLTITTSTSNGSGFMARMCAFYNVTTCGVPFEGKEFIWGNSINTMFFRNANLTTYSNMLAVSLGSHTPNGITGASFNGWTTVHNSNSSAGGSTLAVWRYSLPTLGTSPLQGTFTVADGPGMNTCIYLIGI